MNEPIKKVTSVASIKDIGTWIRASKQIPKFIAADRYEVIVPARYVRIFEVLSSPGWIVLDENELAKEFSIEYVRNRMPQGKEARAGWYFQQLLKIHALMNSDFDDDLVLIWDADTIPLKPLIFSHDERLLYFTGTEYHRPYFNAISRLLKLDKSVNFSFIAQCFPAYVGWVKEFTRHLEETHQKRWFDAILDCTDLGEISGFSEYETLGTFFVHRYIEKMAINHARWERFGEQIAPIGDILNLPISDDLPMYVSYESWSKRIEQPKVIFKHAKSEADFLDYFFNHTNESRSIIQVGANDGEMCDPIFRYLASANNADVSAILIEPVEFYFEKLKKLHSKRPNTLLIKAAASSVESIRDFYHIDPAIAYEMNGDGPKNDWAHGQGSFFRESVVHWIDQNAFRGESYRANMPRFKDAILESKVNCFPLKNLAIGGKLLSLLLIDVQGAELDVLLGMDWCAPPDFIIYEQDIARIKVIEDLLNAMGFSYLCGLSNLVFYNTSTVAIGN
ncbi:DUF6492 family protein [Methylomonas rivi]|uniref:DUF6492 family protein n=1 Tax=Methylomonas rivi TaxID=2952226 RepID=A0ABT1U6F3_9GAMM|nr:DUF6492 family protein [Methylomonas sp. WSC-6]MCQ8128646.1 DUF6492 family protein [Methylomonas sp. WSC-6]